VENLSMHVRLLLTRRRTQQVLAANSQAISMVQTYMEFIERAMKFQMPLQMIAKIRPLFIQALKSLDINGAEEIFVDPSRLNLEKISTKGDQA
jgi:hypothetical protein